MPRSSSARADRTADVSVDESESLRSKYPTMTGMVRLLDDWGLDAGLGFILPGVGDVVTGTGSIALLFTAVKERVPTVILFRMLLNILVDVIFGIVPVVGDLFDLFFRCNRRNLDLIDRYRDGDEDPSFADYALVTVGVLLVCAAVVIPIYFLFGLSSGIAAWLAN